MNKVILAGRLARDPEIKYTQSGKAVASFTLAVNRRYRKEGSNQPTADFIMIVAWDKLAEIVGNHLTKGSQIAIEGRMQVRSYDAQDGSKRYVTEVVANEVEFMGSKQHHDEQPKQQEPTGADSFGPSVPDELIPF